MHANDNTRDHEHDFEPSLFEALREVCTVKGCAATREAPAAPVVGVDVPAGFVVVPARAA
jgi:hypothetical protein